MTLPHQRRLFHLRKLSKIKRKTYHPLIHKIHKEHKISKKTLFYVKEYGKHSNVPKTIIKESIKILILASVISLFGGIAIEKIKNIFISIIPFIILLPVLNDVVGDFGTVISSKFSTMLHEGKVKSKWWKQPEILKLYYQVIIIGGICAIIASLLSLVISSFSGAFSFVVSYKILLICFIDVLFLVTLIFVTSIISGIYVYKKKEDPNNFLIPISTSVADFANMVVLSILIILFF